MIQISYLKVDSAVEACLSRPMPNLNEGQISQSVVLKAKIGIHSERGHRHVPSADFASRLNIRPARSTEGTGFGHILHA